MTRLFLIRHGQTDWNIEGRWQGQVDVPLNATGREQAERMAGKLAEVGLDAIYSSDLRRTLETAEPLAQRTGLEVQTDPRLREIHQGEWQGMLVEDIQKRYAHLFAKRLKNPWDIAPPGGETVKQVLWRVTKAVDDIVIRHPLQKVAVVSHGFALALVRVHYDQRTIDEVWDLVPGNDGWFEIEVDQESSGMGARR